VIPDPIGELVLRYFEMWSTGRAELADEILAADWTDHVNPKADGAAGVRAVVETIAERRPGVRFDIDTTLRDGDLVAAAGVASSDVDPPARHLWLFRAAGGRLAEMWTFDERQPGA
jgi:predicted SnoaL-like aldol condensation-catalyzing enzyme